MGKSRVSIFVDLDSRQCKVKSSQVDSAHWKCGLRMVSFPRNGLDACIDAKISGTIAAVED